jgi:PAS domain S-box-containing protein
VILVVDDDEGLLLLIERRLSREGYAVVTAASGHQALEWLAGHRADLLLLDLKLADIPGEDLLQRLYPLEHAPRFITITGQGDERVAVEMMKKGALDYVVKDARFLDVVPTVVHRALDQLDREHKLAAAETALQREHTFNAAILQTVGALIVVLDNQGRIVRFNRACEQTTGFASSEVVGEVFWRRFVPQDEVDPVRRMFDTLLSRKGRAEHENSWLTRSGELRMISWSNTVLTDEDGNVQYVIGTGIDITDRKTLEREILEISDREQRRIGHDLHDSLGQQLTALEFQGQALVGKLKSAAPALVEPARDICRHIQQTIRNTRLLSHGLSPVPLGEEGLMTALAELAAGVGAMNGVQCEFGCARTVLVTDATVATHLYRIAQEAVNNALKHSRARFIRVRLEEDREHWRLSVEDDGRGLDPGVRKSTGMGLRIMNHRARLVGASLEVQSVEPSGLRIECTVPKRK